MAYSGFASLYVVRLLTLVPQVVIRKRAMIAAVLILYPLVLFGVSDEKSVSATVTLSVIKGLVFTALLAALFASKQIVLRQLRIDGRKLEIVAISTSILSFLIWKGVGYINDDVITFLIILFAVTVYRRILSVSVIVNFFILMTFAYFSEARLAFLVVSLSIVLRFISPYAVVFTGIVIISVFNEQLLEMDFRMMLFIEILRQSLLIENLALTLFGYQSIYVSPESPLFLAVPFLQDAKFLTVNGNDLTFSFLHNQWLHILAQYGLIYLCLVLWILYVVVRDCMVSKKEANFVFLIVIILGFSHSIFFSGSILAAVLCVRSCNVPVSFK